MFTRISLFCCSFIFSLFFALGAFAEVTASVNSIAVVENGNITLTIKDDASSGVGPDLRELRRAFKVLSQRRMVNNSYINGEASSVTEWSYVISPKDKKGKVTIPAIPVGQEKTEPIEIQILTAEGASGNVPGIANTTTESDEVFLRVAVENENPYVQGQVIYVARLYSKFRIAEGALISPNMEDAIVERMGEDLEFTTNMNGQTFRVVERRFAIFPQVSGEMTIPPTDFTGSVIDSKSKSPIGEVFNFGASGFSVAMSGIARPVRILSDTITINVLPKPKEAEGKWWLPAYALRITEAFEPNPPVFKENEAVKRTVRIEAAGLTASQLPDIPVPEDPSLNVYPGKVDVKNNASDRGIIGEVKKSTVLIPIKTGKIVLPEIKIEWWNVMTKKMEVALLPERVFEVKPSSRKNVEPNEPLDESSSQTTFETRERVSPKPVLNDDKGFSFLLLVGGFVGIVFVFLFLLLSRFKNAKHRLKLGGANPWANRGNVQNNSDTSPLEGGAILPVSAGAVPQNPKKHSFLNEFKKDNARPIFEDKSEKTLKQAMLDLEQKAKLKNPKDFRDALLVWARLYFKDIPVLNIVEIAKNLQSPQLQKSLEELNKSLYAGKEVGFNGEAVLKILHTALDKQKKEAKKIKPVPDLYPTTK